MLVNYYSIKPCASGFGEYDAVIDADDIYDDADILNGCAGEVYELGAEDLPEWVEDIRGKIHNEPEKVFVERSNDKVTVHYFGMSRAE
jgi:hypothetical protein